MRYALLSFLLLGCAGLPDFDDDDNEKSSGSAVVALDKPSLLVGKWSNMANPCEIAYAFDGERFLFGRQCDPSSAQLTFGTYTTTVERVTLTPVSSSCSDFPKMPYEQTYSFIGPDTLSLLTAAGVLTLDRYPDTTPMPGQTATVEFGCYRLSDGRFEAMPVAPL